MTDTLSQALKPACPDNAENIDTVLELISLCLFKGINSAVPPALADKQRLHDILNYISGIHEALLVLSKGDYRTPIALKGYTGGSIKEIQGNIRHILWMISQVTEGRLSQNVDYMGEFADYFNAMTKALHESRTALEHQKELYEALARELGQEVQAKLKAQEELKHELQRQRDLASTDELTKVANRRFFLQLAQHELERCRRLGGNLCFAMLDIDKFKVINDTFGHQHGDDVLRHLTTVISRNLRASDVIGRYGGDEFMILFPSTDVSGARHTLERVRRALVDSAFDGCSGEAFTISIGLAVVTKKETLHLEHVVSLADKALYGAKLNGRNCIAVEYD